MRVNDIPKEAAENPIIFDSYVKAQSVLRQHEKPYCSVSGGSDSDVMLDLIWRLDKDKQVTYVWFDTGMEYAATKRHLDFLEKKYGIEIERHKPIKTVQNSVMHYGVPFLSKVISSRIEGLQRHNFKWEDISYDDIMKDIGKGSCYAKWWCNGYDAGEFKRTMYNISYDIGLKEFLMIAPPNFKISSKCCDYAKKKVSAQILNYGDLTITGIRKAESGVRMASYKNCYSKVHGVDAYRPLFWYSNKDKQEYEELFGICHSDCYEVWGLKRTGCVGCPYNSQFDKELAVVKEYEPGLYKVCQHLFGKSYEYTRRYKEFKEEFKKAKK